MGMIFTNSYIILSKTPDFYIFFFGKISEKKTFVEYMLSINLKPKIKIISEDPIGPFGDILMKEIMFLLVHPVRQYRGLGHNYKLK
jgi:hypothetical protein